MPNLYLMRHGQARNDASSDINRRLTSMGQDHVKGLAKLLWEKEIDFDCVFYSPAVRTRETMLLMCQSLKISEQHQNEDKRIYNASVYDLQAVIKEIDERDENVLLVGHNPGLEDLIRSLTQQSVGLSPANIVVVSGETWKDIYNNKCTLAERF